MKIRPKCTVIRTGVSPMNPRVKWAELSCGHDVYRPRRPRIGALVTCDKCPTDRQVQQEVQDSAGPTAPVEPLRDALSKLVNEAEGFLSMASPGVHGHTNIAVLRERIEQGRQALSQSPAPVAPVEPQER